VGLAAAPSTDAQKKNRAEAGPIVATPLLQGARAFQQNGRRIDPKITGWIPPALPESVLAVIRECIEFVDEVPANALAELMRQYQIEHSRIVDDAAILRAPGGHRGISWVDIRHRPNDAAETYARGAALLPFARGDRTDISVVSRDDIKNALEASGAFASVRETEGLIKTGPFFCASRPDRSAAKPSLPCPLPILSINLPITKTWILTESYGGSKWKPLE
jgi:hypothetical protein